MGIKAHQIDRRSGLHPNVLSPVIGTSDDILVGAAVALPGQGAVVLLANPALPVATAQNLLIGTNAGTVDIEITGVDHMGKRVVEQITAGSGSGYTNKVFREVTGIKQVGAAGGGATTLTVNIKSNSGSGLSRFGLPYIVNDAGTFSPGDTNIPDGEIRCAYANKTGGTLLGIAEINLQEQWIRFDDASSITQGFVLHYDLKNRGHRA